MEKLYRLPEVQDLVGGLSASTIYERMAKGTFPLPIKIGLRAVAWRQSDLEEWIETRPQAEFRKKR